MRPTAVSLLPVAISLLACASAPPPPPPSAPPVAVVLPAPAPPPPPSEPEGLGVLTAPPRVCELTRPLDRGPVDLAVLPKVDVFGQVASGVLSLGFGDAGAFAEVRSPGWTLRGVPPEETTRVSAARWIAFGGVLYASKRDRFPVAGTRNGKLLLPAPAVAGFTPAAGAAARETECAEVSLVVDPANVLGGDVPPAFAPAKTAKTMVLRRRLPVPLSADVDGPAGGSIDPDDTDVNVTLLERRGKRARVRMGHLAGWVDGALVVAPPPVRPAPKGKPAPEAAQFGMIGLLSASEQREVFEFGRDIPAREPAAPAESKRVETATTTGALVACSSDVRLVVDWTTSGAGAASAGVTPTARHYVVGVVPAGKPLRVVERGPELSTVALGEGAFLARGYARLTVPSRDIASGCAPATAVAEPKVEPLAQGTDAADTTDAIDRLSATPKDDATARGNMFGDTIGEAFGAGGLGLSGVGEGGTGEGIGLGTIGSGGRLGGGHSTSAPQMREGAIQVNGRLPPEVIRRIVRQNFGRFRLCYENGLRTNPNLQGRVTSKFVIDRTGAVGMTADGGSDLPDSSVTACVVRGFGNLRFPRPEGGIVTVVYPVIFSPR